MRLAVTIALGALTLAAASRADEPPKLDIAAFTKVSTSVDNRFKTLWPDYPADLVGVTHTVYIHGYGAVITAEDLERALQLQKERGDKLGKTLVDLGFVAMRDVLSALSDQLGMPLVTIDGPPAASLETEALSPKFLRQFRCLPVGREDHTV